MDVVVVAQQTNGAIDLLAEDVCVSGVALRVSGDMHHDVMQRDGSISPPRHGSDSVQVEFADRGVCELTSPQIAVDDLLFGFLCSYPKFSGRTCIR